MDEATAATGPVSVDALAGEAEATGCGGKIMGFPPQRARWGAEPSRSAMRLPVDEADGLPAGGVGTTSVNIDEAGAGI